MPEEEKLYDLAELFKVFGDTTRIKILHALSEEEMCQLKQLELAEKKAVYNTLEKVFDKLNNNDDLSTVKLDLAGDIFVAKVSLDMAEKGTINEKELKEFISTYL